MNKKINNKVIIRRRWQKNIAVITHIYPMCVFLIIVMNALQIIEQNSPILVIFLTILIALLLTFYTKPQEILNCVICIFLIIIFISLIQKRYLSMSSKYYLLFLSSLWFMVLLSYTTYMGVLHLIMIGILSIFCGLTHIYLQKSQNYCHRLAKFVSQNMQQRGLTHMETDVYNNIMKNVLLMLSYLLILVILYYLIPIICRFFYKQV